MTTADKPTSAGDSKAVGNVMATTKPMPRVIDVVELSPPSTSKTTTEIELPSTSGTQETKLTTTKGSVVSLDQRCQRTNLMTAERR